MLGLGSMAARLRACRCRACLRSLGATARRLTTSAARTTRTTRTSSNPRRRKILASDVFTACYTAIMATAAVVDAGRKDRRRQDLDHQIAEARSSLASMLERSNARDLAQVVGTAYPDVAHSHPLDVLGFLDDIFKLEPDTLRGLARNRKDRLATVQRTRKMLGLSWNPELPQTKKSTLARCEEIVLAEAERREFVTREPKAEIHLEKVSNMIGDLVERLMREAWRVSEREAPGSRPALNSPDSAYTMVRLLRSDGYPAYLHPDADPAATIDHRAALNKFNLSIVNQWSSPWRGRAMAKICSNLLVCPVPPGMQNYNLLILAFSLIGEHELSSAVVDSFLFLSHMKPTEATYLCLLHHYRLKGDIVGFHALIRRMFGNDPRGIGLMRRTADHVHGQPLLHEWATSSSVALTNGYYVQRAPLTQDIAEAMLEGLVDFGMLREGARLLAVCLRAKWTVSRDLLWRLFHSCLTMVDIGAIGLIIRGLLDNIDEASAMLLGPEPVGPGIVRQMHHLLNVWQATGLPRSGSGAHSGKSRASSSTREREKRRLDHLVTAIWIREAKHYSSMMGWWLKRITQNLSKDDKPLNDRLDTALSVLDVAARHPVQKLHKAEHFGRVAKIHWLATQLVASEYRIRNAENAICNALAKQTPRQLRAKQQFQAHVPIGERIGRALAYSTRGTVEYGVALCFTLSKEVDRHIKKELLRALPSAHKKELNQRRNNSGNLSLGTTMACFEHYLAGLAAQLAENVKEEETVKPGRFARLLEKLSKPGFSFWRGEDAMAIADDPQSATIVAAAPWDRTRNAPAPAAPSGLARGASAAAMAPMGRW